MEYSHVQKRMCGIRHRTTKQKQKDRKEERKKNKDVKD
jgi:hypothetical protein